MSGRPISREGRMLVLLGFATLIAFLAHVGVGSDFWYRPWDILAEIFRGPMQHPTIENSVVWDIRLPRSAMGLCVGLVLGMVGSAFQAQLRNPLADPHFIGVSSGAAVGGVLALVLGVGGWMGGIGLMGAGFVTGMCSLALVYALARRRGVIDVSTLLLAGVAVGSLLAALTSLVLLAAGEDTNRVLQWLLGSLGNVQPGQNLAMGIITFVGAVILISRSKAMNAFAMGEDTAARLGVDVPRLRSAILITGTAMTAATVGCVGIIGFIGLVAPHIARRLVGVDWRWSLPAAGLIGAALLLLADVVAQRGLSAITHTVGFEAPVGAVTALFGAPSLLILLRRTHTAA